MPGTVTAGPLLSPWVGVWELVWNAPEAWLATGSALIGLTMAGAAMTVFGTGAQGRSAEQAADTQTAVVVARTQPQPKSRKGRRRRAA